jgi:hypothetical protein
MAKGNVCTCKPRKLTVPRMVAAIIVFVIVAQVLHIVGAYAGMGYYTDPAYMDVWSPIMMPGPGPPPMEFYGYSIGFGLITAFFFVLVYSLVGCCVPGKSLFSRGLMYGFLIFLVGSLSGILMTFLIVNVPLVLTVLWAIEGLIISLINGVLVAYLIR